jgi:hypothetical protein
MRSHVVVPAAAKAQSISGDNMSGGNEHAGSGYKD